MIWFLKNIFKSTPIELTVEEQYLKTIKETIEVSDVYDDNGKLYMVLESTLFNIKCEMYVHNKYRYWGDLDYVDLDKVYYSYYSTYFDRYVKLSNWKFIVYYSADRVRVNRYINDENFVYTNWIYDIIEWCINVYLHKSDKEISEYVTRNKEREEYNRKNNLIRKEQEKINKMTLLLNK